MNMLLDVSLYDYHFSSAKKNEALCGKFGLTPTADRLRDTRPRAELNMCPVCLELYVTNASD